MGALSSSSDIFLLECLVSLPSLYSHLHCYPLSASILPRKPPRTTGTPITRIRPEPVLLVSPPAVVAADGLPKREIFRPPDPLAFITVDLSSAIGKTVKPFGTRASICLPSNSVQNYRFPSSLFSCTPPMPRNLPPLPF